MARVEWSAIGGDEVETVVSMLLYHEHPRATRIRPSRGDFGIDVLVPRSTDSNIDVYQIKKFALNLTAQQKGQIDESFRRVLLGLIRRETPLGDWYLVMPLDPTLENADWFEELPDRVIAEMFDDSELALTEEEKAKIKSWREAPNRIIEWKGLTYCEALVSKYWFVVDYYLHGGSQRINNAVAEVAKILQRDVSLPATEAADKGSAIVTPAELSEHLQRLGRVLNDGDPHFRYGINIDHGEQPLPDDPGLIAAAQEIHPDGTCITFRIYERFAEALNERPIPIKVKFQFTPGSAEEKAFDEWRKFGKPFSATADLEADLPGGLGGSFKRAQASILPATGAEKYERRWRITAADGMELATVLFQLTSTTGIDRTGAWVQGKDSTGIITMEAQTAITGPSTFKFGMEDPTGREVTEVTHAITFAANLVHPNRIHIAEKYGNFRYVMRAKATEGLAPLIVARYIAALAVLQPHITRPVTVPDLSTVTGANVANVLRAARLVAGETIKGTWKHLELTERNMQELDPNEHYQFATLEPLSVTIGTEEFVVGAVNYVLQSAKIADLGSGRMRATPHLNDEAHCVFAPGVEAPPQNARPLGARPVPPAH